MCMVCTEIGDHVVVVLVLETMSMFLVGGVATYHVEVHDSHSHSL